MPLLPPSFCEKPEKFLPVCRTSANSLDAKGGGRGRTLPRERPTSLNSGVFSFLLLLPDLYKGLLMTCEDILISQVPAVRAEEGISAEGNFVFQGGMERKLDTKAPAELSCCAKCSLFWIQSTLCFSGALYSIYLFPLCSGRCSDRCQCLICSVVALARTQRFFGEQNRPSRSKLKPGKVPVGARTLVSE